MRKPRANPLGPTAFMLPALAIALASGVPTAAAQFSSQPFFEQTEPLRHAFALELMEARLSAAVALLERQAEEATGDLELASELVQEVLDEDLPLVAGTLAEIPEPYLSELEDSARELAEAFQDALLEDGPGGSPPALAASLLRVREGVAQARSSLAPSAREDPVLIGAVMSLLLLSDEGVAEAYEEAVADDSSAYPQAWAALQAVHRLWALLSPEAEERLRADVEEALAELDTLLPAPRPLAVLRGDPEDAEEPAHRIVAALERISGSQLYPDRDLGRLASHTVELAHAGCDALEAGRQRLAEEQLRAAGLSYEYLADLAGLLAPEAHAQALEQFDALEERGAAESCPALLKALEQLRVVVGG